MTIRRFEDLQCWQLARQLTNDVYSITREGRFAKDFELRNQIRRASSSGMHNIAEGFDGGSHAEFIKFLRYARRSCTEVQSQLYLALDQGYLQAEDFDKLYAQAQEIREKVMALIRYLKR